MEDEDREGSIPDTILRARQDGHDALILKRCLRSDTSPGMRSDIFVLFDPARAKFESVELDHNPSQKLRENQLTQPTPPGRG